MSCIIPQVQLDPSDKSAHANLCFTQIHENIQNKPSGMLLFNIDSLTSCDILKLLIGGKHPTRPGGTYGPLQSSVPIGNEKFAPESHNVPYRDRALRLQR